MTFEFAPKKEKGKGGWEPGFASNLALNFRALIQPYSSGLLNSFRRGGLAWLWALKLERQSLIKTVISKTLLTSWIVFSWPLQSCCPLPWPRKRNEFYIPAYYSCVPSAVPQSFCSTVPTKLVIYFLSTYFIVRKGSPSFFAMHTIRFIIVWGKSLFYVWFFDLFTKLKISGWNYCFSSQLSCRVKLEGSAPKEVNLWHRYLSNSGGMATFWKTVGGASSMIKPQIVTSQWQDSGKSQDYMF